MLSVLTRTCYEYIGLYLGSFARGGAKSGRPEKVPVMLRASAPSLTRFPSNWSVNISSRLSALSPSAGSHERMAEKRRRSEASEAKAPMPPHWKRGASSDSGSSCVKRSLRHQNLDGSALFQIEKRTALDYAPVWDSRIHVDEAFFIFRSDPPLDLRDLRRRINTSKTPCVQVLRAYPKRTEDALCAVLLERLAGHAHDGFTDPVHTDAVCPRSPRLWSVRRLAGVERNIAPHGPAACRERLHGSRRTRPSRQDVPSCTLTMTRQRTNTY